MKTFYKKCVVSSAFAGLLMASLVGCSSAPAPETEPTRNNAKNAYSEMEDGQTVAPAQSAAAPAPKAETPAEETPAVAISNVQFKVKPTVMVLPAMGAKGATSIEVIKKNPLAKTAMEVINAYMTERGYSVMSLETQNQLDEVVQLQDDIAGNDADLAYVAGLAVGADINLTFAGSIQNDNLVIDLNASDASTAQLIASESSRQKDEGEGQRVLVQKAVKNAIVALENKVRDELAAELEKGVQYKVVCRLTGDFTDEQAEEISNTVSMKVRKMFNKMQVKSMTRNTYDLVVYADPDKYEDAQMVYAEFYEALSGMAKVRRQNITKKLIILEIQ
ncbi:DUF6175 family protein [Fibrobacter sp. HC4]|uniref:DUF6175 family protein n=1 Tax=Fibrobacter sp. HC4 TaxID=3239812 RepID=UPI0020193FD5|nr:DUF6175 family protein [Fibrobacter succinogenes]MCL4101850.1 hypothetical protein [Fibrobacter succinogenes]